MDNILIKFRWGINSLGQLGINSNQTLNAPTLVQLPVDNIFTIVNGFKTSYALDNSGRLYSTGNLILQDNNY